MSCGIYKFTNKNNGKIYIGQSKNIEQRFKNHIQESKTNKKKSIFDTILGELGSDAFTFDIIEECNENELNDKEIFWIAYYQSNQSINGYNSTCGGSGQRNKKTNIPITGADIEYISIKDFSNKVNVTPQAIYKKLNGTFAPYVKVINGVKMIHQSALVDFYNISPQTIKNDESILYESKETIIQLKAIIKQKDLIILKQKELIDNLTIQGVI